jgi:hypothetical protein
MVTLSKEKKKINFSFFQEEGPKVTAPEKGKILQECPGTAARYVRMGYARNFLTCAQAAATGKV